MASLRAIDPDRRRAVNHNAVCRRRRGRGTDGHEARVEALGAGRVERDGLAGLRKGGLRDGVVVGRELELHHVADVGFDVVGRVAERAI